MTAPDWQQPRTELPTGNHLKPNGHGGFIVRQSDLSAWSRCHLQKYYYDAADADPLNDQPRVLSATVYGTVVHYALMLLETMVHEGNPDAVEIATATFRHYWHPNHIGDLPGAAPVQEWLPRQTWQGLMERGERVIRDYGAVLPSDTGHLLALEYQFAVPLAVNGRLHTLTGTMDRLTIRKHYNKPYLSIEDFKTGRQPTYLRWNMQGTAYAYASCLPPFWTGWDASGVEVGERFPMETVDALQTMFNQWGFDLVDHHLRELPVASRKFRWINMADLKVSDGGWRTDRDYARLALAIDGYVRAHEAGAYSLTTTGEVCQYCDFRRTCGGPGLAEEKDGAP